MSTTLSPNMPAQTPASEKSVYYDANDASSEHVAHASASSNTVTPPANSNFNSNEGHGVGADVARKPSVATGALESRETNSGGTFSNKHEGRNDNGNGNVRDSGYAAGPNTKEKHNNVAFAAPQDVKQEHETEQPSPAYVDSGNTYGGGDSKTGTGGTNAGADAVSGSPTQTQNRNEPSSKSPAPSQGQGQSHSPTTMATSDKEHHASGAFANGAAVTGPDAIPEDIATQHDRTATAESHLSEQTKAKITKSELKDAKRLMKVIKAEGASQKANHAAFLKELSKLQKVQKQASKDESKALAAHGKATTRAHKLHTRFLEAKAAYEQAEADAKAQAGYVESSRTHAQNTTAELSTKTRELEELRRAKAVDDREREAKLAQLSQIGRKKN